MRLFLIAGEASGDARGAELMRALRDTVPDLDFQGAGGPQMREIAGPDFMDWADEAVVGLWDVLKKYGYFRAQFHHLLGRLGRADPTALILIDYPGFNLRLAKAARRRMPHLKIIYYVSPQVWAWNRGRIPRMAEYLNLMLCIFPFEQPLYESSGLPAAFVGHPLLDTLRRRGVPREPDLVGLFPGSRSREIRKIFPIMLAAGALLREKRPEIRLQASAASPVLAEQMVSLASASHVPCEITLHSSHSLMERAGAGMVASGTATLEAAFFGLPLVILYKVAWLTWAVGKRLVRVPFLGMPNILAGREIAREFLQDAARPIEIAAEVLRLLGDESARTTQQGAFREVISSLGEPGAGRRAALAVCREIGLPSESASTAP